MIINTCIIGLLLGLNKYVNCLAISISKLSAQKKVFHKYNIIKSKMVLPVNFNTFFVLFVFEMKIASLV